MTPFPETKLFALLDIEKLLVKATAKAYFSD